MKCSRRHFHLSLPPFSLPFLFSVFCRFSCPFPFLPLYFVNSPSLHQQEEPTCLVLSCHVLSCLVSRIHRIESDEYGFKSLRARVIIQPRQPRRAGTLAARVEGAVRTEVIRALYTHTHHTHTSHTHNTHAIHTRTRAHAQCHVSSHV